MQGSDFMKRAQDFFTPERTLAFQGIGQGLTQLAAGAMPDLSPSYQALQQRQQADAMRKSLEGSGVLEKFTPQQRALLAQMEPGAAQSIIAQTLFAPKPGPTKGVEINGQLVDPLSGRLIGDFRDAPKTETVRIVSGGEAAKFGLPGDGAFELTFDSDMRLTNASAIGGGGTNVTVNSGSEVGTIPQGYELVTDEVTGARSMRPIPGGPADTTENEAVAKAARDRSGGVVTEDIERALSIVNENPKWTTGFGSVFQSVPGTQAKTLSGILTTIRANVGFDRLQAMRDSSPTGGALGAINQSEMTLLQNALGNLEQSSDADDLRFNLERLNDIYLEIIHGPASAAATDDPLGLFK